MPNGFDFARRMTLLAGLICLPGALFAQRYSFKSYGQPEGLRNIAVQCLLQDHEGFLWVGTQNGLFRYDGWRFVGFSKAEGLPNPYVESLHEGPDGTLWVGTRSGLVRRSGAVFKRADLGPSTEILGNAGIASDAAGNLYVGTAKGLMVGRRSAAAGAFEFHPAPAPPEVGKAAVFGVHADPEGVVWFGCGRALCRMESDRVSVVGAEQGVPSERWDAIVTDREANLWIRSSRRLLVRHKGSRRFIDQDTGLPQSADFGALSLDRRGRLFVPTDRGLAFWEGGAWKLIGGAQGLEIDATTCLLEDREGSIWVGLRGSGLARWLGYNQWEGWTRAEGLSSDTVWAIRRDRAGALWVGTDNGLDRLGPGEKRWQVWNEQRGLGGNRVRAITLGPDGAIWTGSDPGGVSRLIPGTGTVVHYGPHQGLTSDRVLTLMFDPEQRLWVSARSGLFRSTALGPSLRFERQGIPGTDDNEMFYQTLFDSRGRLWVAGSRGLARLEGGVWTRFTAADGLKSNTVCYLAEASDGVLWIGYREAQGISRLTFSGGRPRVENFNRQNGLRSDQAIFLGLDKRGRVWYGSDDGIDAFDGTAWRHYGRSDGLIWDDCDGNAFFADPDGSVWIGTSRGLSRFRPSDEQPAPAAPPVRLTAVQLGEKPQDLTGPLKVPYRDRPLLVDFTALTFLRENDVRFRYRLRGLEQKWVETEHREARYPSLGPGEYVFEVVARGGQGVWSEVPAQLAFQILPAWWQTWWFRGAVVAAILLLGLGGWQWRLQRLLVQRRQLEKAVEQRTRELLLEKEKYRAIVDTTNEWIWEIDSGGRITYSNAAAEAILGYSPGELIGRDNCEFLHEEDRRTQEKLWSRLLAEKRGWTALALRRRHKDGTYRQLESNAVPILDEHGTVLGYRGADRDITERKRSEGALRESEERYKLAVGAANDGLWDWNLNTDRIYLSPRWKAMLGYEEREVGDSPDDWFSRVHPEDLGRLKVEIGVGLEGHNQHFENEHRMRHKDSSYRWMLSRGLAVMDAQGRASRMAGSQTDITLRKEAEQRLLYDAFHDELTGLPNRALFMERLERAAVRAKRRENQLFAVLFLDLDRFKVINDSLGHMIGDQLLVGIARRLEACLRSEDTAARLGGDEFVILVEDLKAMGEATQLAQRIQGELQQPFLLNGHEVYTTASIGIALSVTGYQRPEDLLRDADTVMYRAKALGKARHEVFHAGLHARAVERLELETDLRRAVERREFVLHYQPIVSREGEITSVEALVRWNHPERGLVQPAEFIPVAEETGLIMAIDAWVMRTACAQNRAWGEAGCPPVRVSVNLSAKQFQQPNFSKMVARVLKETGLEARLLELELTESIVLHSTPATVKTLDQLSAMGIRMSIDDFGTGYSSLRYLLQFPIDTLKIDRSFIRDITADRDCAAVSKAIIDLGHSFKLNVIAEGVETEAQRSLLVLQGCDEMQGYVFSPPLPAEKMARLLQSRLCQPPLGAALPDRRSVVVINA